MKLIHIGLPKTGSTSFQEQWRKRRDITSVSDKLQRLVDNTRKIIRSSSDPNELVDFWPKASQESPITIYSSEGFSGLPWGRAATSEEYDYGHYLFANLSKEMVPDAKILLFIRSPESWLRSVYLQMIHEGHSFGFCRFIRHQRSYLANALDLKNMLRHWDEAFGEQNVIVYPFERIIASPAQANEEISDALNIPASLNLFQLRQRSNVSLNNESAQLLRALTILNRRIQGRNEYLSSSFKKLNDDFRLLYRVELQSHPRKFSFINRLLNPLEFTLPPVEKKYISSLINDCFLSEIARRGDKYNTVAAYEDRLNKYFDSE